MSILISSSSFAALPLAHKVIILEAAEMPEMARALEATATSSTPALPPPDGNLVRFSEADVVEFFRLGMADKTADTLKKIIEQGADGFVFSDLLKAVGVAEADWMKMNGVWSGLTKRTRTISKNPQGWLLRWQWDKKRPVVSTAVMDPVTYQSFKTYFDSLAKSNKG